MLVDLLHKYLPWPERVLLKIQGIIIPKGKGGGGGGGLSYERGGMLVDSLRGVNFRFWSRLGCSGQNTIIFSRRRLF